MRIALSLLTAVLVGALALFMAGAPAFAYTPPSGLPSNFNPVTPAEVDYARKIFEATVDPADPAKRAKARQIITRQSVRTLPRLAPRVLGRGGLVGAAAGVWTVVGLELVILPCWECGVEDLPIDGEVQLASGAMYGWTVSRNGQVNTQAWVRNYTIKRDSANNWTAQITGEYGLVSVQRRTFTNGTEEECALAPGLQLTAVSTLGQSQCVTGPIGNVTSPSYGSGSYTKSAGGTGATWAWEVTAQRPSGSVRWKVCDAAPASCESVDTPTYDFGKFSPASSAPSGAYRTSPGDGSQFVNSVVADPEAPQVLPDEDQPLQEPDPEWDPNTDPFSPLFDPFADPEGDPDGDDVPNRDDPDPEEDGDTDGDGDPNEHPPLGPWPEPDDPEEDGDPDHDGSPDETDPPIQPDPYDPTDNPDGDPDEDGIPNEDDPDPVVPTDPTTLPDEHPYADPDEDGQPNRDDTDDDNDDVPDEIDPEPANPDEPARYTRTDTDVDGSPDTFDPLPEDDTVPDGGPDGDPDSDGTPNRHDPSPTDPSRPGDATSDPDQDGTENQRDPDPYRQSDPQGGPTGDADQDGTPNSEDPAPEDETVPAEWMPNCPPPLEADFELPSLDLESIFPFSLILWVWDALGELNGPRTPPSFQFGSFGTVTVPAVADQVVSVIRACVGFVAICSMALWFYRYISGKGGE